MTKKHKWILSILMLAGIAMRILGAWWFAEVRTADNGIICMMVKHTLEGKGMPTFFYGLPYMGSIEPMASVVFCKLFGFSGFMVNMGTAIMGIMLLPIVYLWGRDAGGGKAGLGALAFCVIGPEFYFQFQCWADGGYAAIVLISALIIWFGMRSLQAFKSQDRITIWRVMLLGFIAGVGWFQSPLLISSYLTLGLIYIIVLRMRIFSWRVLLGLPAFILGSLPWWIWNIQNHWKSFNMLNSEGNPGVAMGLKLFFSNRIIRLLDVFDHPMPLRIVIISIWVLCIAGAIVALLRISSDIHKSRRLYISSALLFISIFALLFTRSKLAWAPAIRYLLPLVAPLAVLLASGSARIAKRLPFHLGWVGLSLLIGLQITTLPKRAKEQAVFLEFKKEAEQFGEMLAEKNITHLYSEYQVHFANHGLNSMLNEQFVFTDFVRERYGPYAVSMECCDNPAVLNNHGNLSAFLQATRASASTLNTKRLHAQYDIKFKDNRPALLSTSLIASIIDEQGNDKLEALTDSRLLTGLSSQHNNRVTVTVKLTEPKKLTSLRLLPNTTFMAWSIALLDAESGEWIEILPETSLTGFFKSGPRFYYGSNHYRIQAFFDSVSATAIRVTLKGARQQIPAAIAEISLFEKESKIIKPDSDINLLLKALTDTNVDSVYADRWESAKIDKHFGGRMRTIEAVHTPFCREEWLEKNIEFTPKTAIVVRSEDAALMNALFVIRGIDIQSKPVGSWMLYHFSDEDWHSDFSVPHGLKWVGYGAVLKPSVKGAVQFQNKGLALRKDGNIDEAIYYHKKALSMCADFQPAWQSLAECYLAKGLDEEASIFESLYSDALRPKQSAAALFKKADLLGLTMSATEVVPGSTFDISWYWKYNGNNPASHLAAFVHFRHNGKTCFQGDYVLLPELLEPAPYDKVYQQKTTINIPESIEPGEYTIWVGLYHRKGPGRRIKPKTELPVQRRAVCMPAVLKILGSESTADGVVE